MPFVIFSGLPGSGKSTLARRLAPELAMPVLDKDNFLDALFDERGLGGAAWRAALSREADSRFAAAAQAVDKACLVSWWRHPSMAGTESGTSTDWLRTLPGGLIEVHCECSVDTAARRFVARTRHPGHLDSQRTVSSIHDRFRSLPVGPLACGPVISVSTEGAVSLGAVTDRVREALRTLHRDPEPPA